MSDQPRIPFAVMAKPAGSLCNMRCSYCYYLEKDAISTHPERHRMPDDLLETYIRQYIAGTTGPAVSFVWHGGEPTLAGMEFYRKVITLQKKYLPAGWKCWNNLQTNGLLLDDTWCAFLAENHFDVGLSIDGAAFVHDTYRKDAAGNPTYDRVRQSALRLKAHGIRPDLLCTVTSDSLRDPIAVYRGLRDLDTGWIQFIPIVRRREDGSVTEDSVTPEGYGSFLTQIFDDWLLHDMGRLNVQLFAETGRILSGGEPGLCWMAPTCGRVLVVEQDGNVYSCDHFVSPEHRLGNLETDNLRDLAALPEQERFGRRKQDDLPETCRKCPWLSLCNGACPKDRFAVTGDGQPGLYYLCEGLCTFFAHAVPKLRRVLEERRKGISPAAIMAQLRHEEQEKWRGIGRNDPCPCGSGKKAKNCCWNKRP